MNQNKLAAQLKELFEIQDATNEKAIPGWRTKDLNWAAAITVETGELLDHSNYKWWSKADPDWKQAQMEAIDILHFVLSLTMVTNVPGDYSKAGLPVLVELLKGCEAGTDPDYHKDLIEQSCLTMVSHAIAWNIPRLWEHWAYLCYYLGLSWAEIYAKFIGKAALNRFRWENGYGSTYQKIWNGREDNEYLTELVESALANDVEPSVELFTEQLSDLYQQFTVQ